MKMSISEIDWDKVEMISIPDVIGFYSHDKLAEFLNQLPFEKWNEVNEANGKTFLHYAAKRHFNAMKMLLLRKPDIVLSSTGRTPLHEACSLADNNAVIELICAYRTSLISFHSMNLYLPIDQIVASYGYRKRDSAYTLIANGARLKSVKYPEWIHQELRDFEEGVLQCRDGIVVLLGLKKRKQVLGKLDRFLIRQELAVAIWTTRREQEWQRKCKRVT